VAGVIAHAQAREKDKKFERQYASRLLDVNENFMKDHKGSEILPSLNFMWNAKAYMAFPLLFQWSRSRPRR
jgi:hypothetical protein